MISFTKNLVLMVGLLALSSGQFVVFGSNPALPYTDVEANKLRLAFSNTAIGAQVKDIQKHILTLAAADPDTNPGNFRHVCKAWRDIIDEFIDKQDKDRKYIDLHPIWQKIIRASYGGLGHDAVWETILNGELVYKPDRNSDVGMVSLKISDLHNPFAESFDLSQCGDASKYVRISMGLRKGKKDENESKNKKKDEIWFIPRFMATHKLKDDASYLKEIIGQWSDKVPMAGIFNQEDWNNSSYEYSCWADLVIWSQNNFSNIYLDRENRRGRVAVADYCCLVSELWTKFHISFLNSSKEK